MNCAVRAWPVAAAPPRSATRTSNPSPTPWIACWPRGWASSRASAFFQGAEAGHRILSGDSHRPPLLQRPQHRFDETAVAIAAGAITVGTDIRQLALGIPDRQGRTAWPVGPACRQRPVGQLGEGTAGRRLAAAADKLHALGA